MANICSFHAIIVNLFPMIFCRQTAAPHSDALARSGARRIIDINGKLVFSYLTIGRTAGTEL